MNKNEKNSMRNVAMLKMTFNLYFLIATNFLFLVSIIFPVLWLTSFSRSIVDIVAVGLLFPGLAALTSCTLKFRESGNSVKFAILKHFAEGFRKNVVDTLKYCFVIGLVAFVFMFNMDLHGVEMPLWLGGSLAVLTALTAVITTYMMVVATKFQFRIRDLLRVAIYCLLMHFGKTLKVLGLYMLLLFVWVWGGTFSLLMLVSTLVYLIVHVVYPVLTDVQANFVTPVGDEEKKEAFGDE